MERNQGLGWIIATALIGWVLWLLAPILTPFVAAGLLAYIGDPLADRLENRKLPRTRFSPRGRVRFESVDAGFHDLALQLPDGSFLAMEVDLAAGQEWIVEFELNGASRLVVEVVAQPGAPLPDGARLMAEYRDAHGRTQRRYVDLPADGVVLLTVPAGEILLLVNDGSHAVYASATVSVTDGEELPVRLLLSDEEFRVRVVDGAREAVANAKLFLYDAAGGPFVEYDVTDAAGLCSFRGLPRTPLVAGLVHAARGNAWGLPVPPLGDSDQVVEFEFDPQAAVEVWLFDGDEPAAGLSAQLQEPVRGVPIAVPRTSDARGSVRWDKLGVGAYRLVVRHEDYWPLDCETSATHPPSPVALQVRRLGDLRLEVRSASGLPVAAQHVGVTSLEHGTAVAEWVAAGRVESVPSSGATDAKGELALRGLPHGRYGWRIEPGADDGLAGIVDVRPGELTVASIRVP